MDKAGIERVSAWTVASGLAGDSEIILLQGFCERCFGAGLELSRGTALIDTLHPVHEGRAFFWSHDTAVASPVVEYGRTSDGQGLEGWKKSPFYHLLQSGHGELRCRLELGETAGFPIVAELRSEGQTDYLAMVNRFGAEAAIGDMDCFYSRWTTARPGGFSDADVAALRQLVPVLGLAVKSVSLARVAQSLVEAYLGRDAGRRVLQGRMSRGVVDRIRAVIWFSEMRDYASISEDMASDRLIPLLDDYAEAAISAIHGADGDVLKLMGAGVLAIFNADDPAQACRAALAAQADLSLRLAELNRRRAAEQLAVTSIDLGLHIGDVFYGNIGSNDRLDFTVVGPAVNEVSRIAAMCRSADRDLLLSSAFFESLPLAERSRLVAVGRYALRGFARAQQLFTLVR